MCGNHSADGTPIDHHHGPERHPDGTRRIFRPTPHPRSRRAFLGEFGRGTMAVAVLTPAAIAACSSDATETTSDASVATGSQPTTAPDPTAVEPSADPTSPPADATAPAESPTAVASDDESSAAEPLVWARSNLGFVSAYVLARGNTAAIIDTGTPGSAGAIGETLATLGLNYNDVAHVILTHSHGDHAGSIREVLAEAVNATAYAGEADLGSINADLTGIMGGDDIFGFEMLHTPGHTAGHMAVIDHQAGVLVAGDAIFTDGGGAVEGSPQFFDDIPLSRESIKAMAALSFNTLLVGHGDPIEERADSAVAALAASF